MDSHPDQSESAPVDRQRLLDLVVFEYRSLVVRRLAVTSEWRVLEWTDAAACGEQPAATPELCNRCPVVAQTPPSCLTRSIRSQNLQRFQEAGVLLPTLSEGRGQRP